MSILEPLIKYLGRLIKVMQVVILAGGFGTRLSEETDLIPKPLVRVGKFPIIVHIISHFFNFGHTEFIIAGGYKVQMLEDFFSKEAEAHGILRKIRVSVEDTGVNSNTAQRIVLLKHFLVKDFFVTYGDGLSDVNLDELVSHRRSMETICTVTAVRPPPRFGNVEIKDGIVTKFAEKDPLSVGWINGGYFSMTKEIFHYIEDSDTSFENEPMQRLVTAKQLSAYRHEKFWQPMDTLREKRVLEDIWNRGRAPWENTRMSLR